jgi:hypothetical protein
MTEKEQCKKMIWSEYRQYRCSRKAWKDGYCKQHHPEEIAVRKKDRYEKWTAKWELEREKSPQRRLEKANIEIARLREALKDIVLWAEGSTCEICGVKKMTETDAYDYAMKALEAK